MSHHLDSPIARQDVRLDITDLYVFRGQAGTVFIINVCHSLGKPTIPGYHPEGMYEFKVDLNGDAVEEITYRLTFDERDQHGQAALYRAAHSWSGSCRSARSGTVIAQGTTDEPLPRHRVCAPGPATLATHSGLSQCTARGGSRVPGRYRCEPGRLGSESSEESFCRSDRVCDCVGTAR